MASYSIDLKYEEKLSGTFEVKFLLGIVRYVYKYSENCVEKGLYLFRHKLKDKAKKDEADSPENSIKSKLKELFALFNDKSNEKLSELVKSTVIKLFNHLKPKELEGNFEFGCGDPYYTGKVLEIFTFLYATMGDRLKVIPQWDELMFRGNFRCKGKFSAFYVVHNALKLLNDKDFKEWRNKHNG